MEEPTITIPSMGSLANTCLKWGADGDLTALDLDWILERLARVDQYLADQRLSLAHAARPLEYPVSGE